MKKTSFYLATGLSFLMFVSCQKANTSANAEPITETVNASINANESFKYTLPASTDNSSFVVETAGAKSANSSIISDPSGSSFIYTPVANSTGTDVVVITNSSVQPPPSGCGHHHGSGQQSSGNGGQCGNHNGGGAKHRHHHDCDKGAKTKHSITFNITINGSN